jgi:hypothetical protein
LLPIVIDYEIIGLNGNLYFVEIEIFESENLGVFSEGVNATFKLFKIDENGERQIIYLIDNHIPYGFHEHDRLPGNHESRSPIHVKSWQEAWVKFQEKCREKTK